MQWFVLRGFNRYDKSETGFLAIDKSRASKNVYKIVEDREDAMKFPSTNVYGTDSFGTPKQWLEFFKGEEELSSWKFHLLKTNAPIS